MRNPNKLPLTSTHWGTYRVKVNNGRVQELLAFEQDADLDNLLLNDFYTIFVNLTNKLVFSHQVIPKSGEANPDFRINTLALSHKSQSLFHHSNISLFFMAIFR